MLVSQESFLHFKIYTYNILDSTQTQAKKLLDDVSSLENLVVISKIQTSGKGRNGKTWFSDDENNLYFSLIINPIFLQPELYSVVSALVLAKVFISLELKPKIKWPNDIYINDAKVSGILLELHKNKLIIGVGVNLSSSPELSERKTTDLKKSNIEITPENFLKNFLRDFITIEKIAKDDFSQVKNEIEKLLHNKDNYVTLNFHGKEINGHIIGIDISGNLLLKTKNGIVEKYNAGEIILYS